MFLREITQLLHGYNFYTAHFVPLMCGFSRIQILYTPAIYITANYFSSFVTFKLKIKNLTKILTHNQKFQMTINTVFHWHINVYIFDQFILFYNAFWKEVVIQCALTIVICDQVCENRPYECKLKFCQMLEKNKFAKHFPSQTFPAVRYKIQLANGLLPDSNNQQLHSYLELFATKAPQANNESLLFQLMHISY